MRPISGTARDFFFINNTFINVTTGFSSSPTYSNIQFLNNTILNHSTSGWFLQEAAGNGVIMKGNYVDRSQFVRITGSSNNLTILNNQFNNSYYNSLSSVIAITTGYANNLTISNNNFVNLKKGIQLYNSSQVAIINNTFYNSTGMVWGNGTNFVGPFIDLYHESDSADALNRNVLINSNIFNLSSLAIRIINNTNLNLTISSNNFDQLINNYDEYDNGFLSIRAGGITFDSNNFTRIGCVGIMLSTNTTDVNIINNYFDANLSYNLDNKVNCAYEPTAAIITSELWKTWQQYSPNNRTAGINFFSLESNKGINISNNSFGNGIPVLLKTQGTRNLIHDFDNTNSWLYSYQTPDFLLNQTDLYINNNWENISTTSDNGGYYPFSDNSTI